MYLLVITDDRFKFHNAVTLDTIEAVRVALMAFSLEFGFSTMLFKFNPESEIYDEIFPEVLDYE